MNTPSHASFHTPLIPFHTHFNTSFREPSYTYPHFEPSGQAVLRIKRPNDYKPELVPSNLQPLSYFNLNALDMASLGGGGESTEGIPPGRIFCGGLPYHLTDEQVKELLGAFGEIKNFNLVRDSGSNTSKGYAFCEYMDMETTTTAIAGLHGLPIADKVLTVRLAAGANSGSSSGSMITPNVPNVPSSQGQYTQQLCSQLQSLQQLQQQQQQGIAQFPSSGNGSSGW